MTASDSSASPPPPAILANDHEVCSTDCSSPRLVCAKLLRYRRGHPGLFLRAKRLQCHWQAIPWFQVFPPTRASELGLCPIPEHFPYGRQNNLAAGPTNREN